MVKDDRRASFIGFLAEGQAGSMEQEVRQAAWLLEDAMHDRLVETYPEEPEARHFHFEVLDAERWYMRALIGITILSIFEVPPWCDAGLTDMFPHEKCKMSPDGHPVYLSGLPYIPICFGLAIEVVLIMVLLRKFILQYKMEQNYFRPIEAVYRDPALISFGMKMCLIAFADIALCVCFNPGFRLAFVARSGLLGLLPPVQRLGKCVINVVGELASVVGFLVGTIIFFAWVAVTIFDDLDGVNNAGQKINSGLDRIGTSIYTMFVAGTTDDFVDCFLPTFIAYRQVGLLWLVFLVVVQILLLNLVLDTLVVAYMQYAETTEDESCGEQVRGIVRAFKVLSAATGEADQVNRGGFLKFCAALNESPSMRGLTPHTADIIFRAMDTDKSGTMSEDEFCDICGVFQYEFWVTRRDSKLKDWAPALWNSPSWQWFRQQVWNENFNYFMNCILMLNFGLVIVESVYDLHNWPEPKTLSHLDMVFSLAYVGEVGGKLGVWSFEEYWSDTPNKFDFWTTWLLLGTQLFQGDLARYANLLRLLRLLRVLKQLKSVKSVQFMSATVQKLVIASKDILLLLAVCVFFFTLLGVQCFGGLLYDGSEALADSDYMVKRWSIFNFNDTAMSFSLWVVCLLCEYVPDFAEAVALTSKIPGSWLIFLVFYIMVVAIIFELVKAFTIEVFMVLHEKKNKEVQPDFEGIEDVEKMFEEQGESLHYRSIGDTLRREKILAVYKEMLEEEEEEDEGDGEAKEAKSPPKAKTAKEGSPEKDKKAEPKASPKTSKEATSKSSQAPKPEAAAKEQSLLVAAQKKTQATSSPGRETWSSGQSPGDTSSVFSGRSPGGTSGMFSTGRFTHDFDVEPDHDIEAQIDNMQPRFPDKTRDQIYEALVKAKGHAGLAARALSGRKNKG